MRWIVSSFVLAGWLAEMLASTNGDVDRCVEAYGESRFDEALEAIDAAIDDLGDRPELLYDRGLVLLAQGEHEPAKAAFERGTESEDPAIKGSSHYELGNLAFDAEDWEGAIAAYIACLRAVPGHESAKWNLELAYARQREQQEKDDQEQPQEEEEKDEPEEEGTDEGSEGPEGTDEGGDDATDDASEAPEQGSEGGDEPPEDGGEDETQGAGAEPQPEPSPEPTDESKPPDAKDPDEAAAPAPARAIDRADIDAALDQLDQQDTFMMGRPSANKPVAKDW